MYEPPKCRKCGRVIAFVNTKAGKQMPVDGFSVYIQPFVRGSVFYNADGTAIRGTECKAGDKGAVKAFKSHFVTCPYRDELRKTPTKSARRENVRKMVEREREEAAAREQRRREKERRAEAERDAAAAQFSLFPDPSWR